MQYTNGNPAKVERNVSLAADRSFGATYRELSIKYDLSQAHISRILNDKEIKDVIETGTRQMIARVPLAISRYDAILNNPKHSDHYKSIKDCLTMTGILPSHTQSQTIVNIFNQSNTIVSDPGVLRAIERYSDDDIIDVDLGLDGEDMLNQEHDK